MQKKIRKHLVSLNLEQELHAAIKRLAAEQQQTITGVLNATVRRGLGMPARTA